MVFRNQTEIIIIIYSFLGIKAPAESLVLFLYPFEHNKLLYPLPPAVRSIFCAKPLAQKDTCSIGPKKK
jgi:hypothetical protein